MGGLQPRLLVLGAGVHQVPLISRAEELGIEVVVADYLADSPGKAIASHVTMVDALDTEACIELARAYDVAGVMTTGTDMPVVTMAEVAARLGLSCYLTPVIARLATNKVAMVGAIDAAGGRRPRSRVARSDGPAIADSLSLPIVVKPADSQGQRGISTVDKREDVRSAIEEAIKHSRSHQAVVEEFIAGPEITVNAWVEDGDVRIVAINDRETYNPPPAVGIAYRHIFPSVHGLAVHEEATRQARIVAAAYSIRDGPLYIQMLVRDQEVFIVEGAARVGGGHESELLPLISGFNVVDRLLDLALPDLGIEIIDHKPAAPSGLVTFLYANDGIVTSIEGFDNASCHQGGGFYVPIGSKVRFPRDGTDRVGYVLSTGPSRDEAIESAERCIDAIELKGASDRSLVHQPDPAFILAAT